MQDFSSLTWSDRHFLRGQAESILATLGIDSDPIVHQRQDQTSIEIDSTVNNSKIERIERCYTSDEKLDPSFHSEHNFLQDATSGTIRLRTRFGQDKPHAALNPSAEHDSHDDINRRDKISEMSASPTGEIGKRKSYRSSTRTKSHKCESERRKSRRSHIMSLSNLDMKKKICCKRKCFMKTDHVFLRSEASRVLQSTRDERKRYLRNLLEPRSMVFHFSGLKVCYRFLESAFMFSRHLQSSVKKSEEIGIRFFSNTKAKDPESPHRDAVICFLDRFAESTADCMPDSNERHLPLFQKKAVYEVFCKQYSVLYGDCDPPSLPYFYSTWKKHCRDIKVRRIQRFTKCTECEYIRDALGRLGTDIIRTAPLLHRRRLHIEMVAKERREYQKKCEYAALYPSRVTSLIVDGADQSGYGLPHFSVNTKATAGHSLKVKLVGVLEHGARKRLSLYTMTAEHETGANHIIEAVHRTLSIKAESQPLQGVLYLQVDNCTRENKNTFLFCYMECLVAWGVFQEVFVSFLPVGHTHTDIDQAFSCTSRRLHSNDAATMEDLHEELRKSFTPQPFVVRMLHIINFSGLCCQSNAIGKVKPFSKYRYFRFYRDYEAEQNSVFFRTACDVKIFCDDEWEPLPTFAQGLKGFTIHPPSLHLTPSTTIRSPPEREKVLQRLRSEETRINSPEKIGELISLIESVYRNREEPLHWNLEKSFELSGIYKTDMVQQPSTEDEEITMHDSIPVCNLPYSRNRFVAVNGEGCTKQMPFWIGQILECIRNEQGVIAELFIRWYEVYDKGNAWSGKYRPAVLGKGKNTMPWNGTISVDSVITEFSSLTNKKIRTGVEKEIRAGLSLVSEK